VGRKRKELSFEEAMDRLEELTAALEKGDLTLEEALVCFRRVTICWPIARHFWKPLKRA
jgi:exonuclease VII small subunit